MLIRHETQLYCRLYNSILKLLYRRMHNAFPRVWNFPYFDMFEDLLLHRYLEILQISGGGKGSVAVLMVPANVYHIIVDTTNPGEGDFVSVNSLSQNVLVKLWLCRLI